jgi:hypothetical protein
VDKFKEDIDALSSRLKNVEDHIEKVCHVLKYTYVAETLLEGTSAMSYLNESGTVLQLHSVMIKFQN